MGYNSRETQLSSHPQRTPKVQSHRSRNSTYKGGVQLVGSHDPSVPTDYCLHKTMLSRVTMSATLSVHKPRVLRDTEQPTNLILKAHHSSPRNPTSTLVCVTSCSLLPSQARLSTVQHACTQYGKANYQLQISQQKSPGICKWLLYSAALHLRACTRLPLPGIW